MSFSSTITFRDNSAKRRMHYGTFTNDGSSIGGDISTGLETVECMFFTCAASAVGNSPVVDETLPCAGNAVTIVTDADEVGTWMAIGR